MVSPIKKSQLHTVTPIQLEDANLKDIKGDILNEQELALRAAEKLSNHVKQAFQEMANEWGRGGLLSKVDTVFLEVSREIEQKRSKIATQDKTEKLTLWNLLNHAFKVLTKGTVKHKMKKMVKTTTHTALKIFKNIPEFDPKLALTKKLTLLKKEGSLNAYLDKEFSRILSQERSEAHKDMRVVESTFSVDGRNYQDHCERLNTALYINPIRLPLLKDKLVEAQNKLTQKENELKKINEPGEKRREKTTEKQRLNKQIALLEKKIDTAQKQEKEGALRSSYEAGYTLELGTKRELAVNAHVQTLKDANGNFLFQIARSGAMHDFSLEGTNITEMIRERESMELLKELQPKRFKALCDKIEETKSVLQQMAFAQLADQANRLGQQIKKDMDSDTANFHLDTECFNYTQISLLRGSGKEAHMNANQLYALGSFEGKKVIFNGKEGLDDKGNIQLPLIEKNGDPLSLKIDINMCQIDVKAGSLTSKKKTELSQYVSEKFQVFQAYLAWSRKNFPKEWNEGKARKDELFEAQKLLKKISEKINRGIADYELAADIAEFELLIGNKVGINCKSGKDRTSEAILALQRRYIRKTIQRPTRETEKILIKETRQKGCSRFIQKLNTGFAVYKHSLSNWFSFSRSKKVGTSILREGVKSYFVKQ